MNLVFATSLLVCLFFLINNSNGAGLSRGNDQGRLIKRIYGLRSDAEIQRKKRSHEPPPNSGNPPCAGGSGCKCKESPCYICTWEELSPESN